MSVGTIITVWLGTRSSIKHWVCSESASAVQNKPGLIKEPVGTMDTIRKGVHWVNSKLRRIILGVGVGAMLSAAALTGCGRGENPTTTESLPSTTSISQPVTTSEQPTTTALLSTTTTGQQTTTTVVSANVGIDKAFISQVKTIKDVTGKVPQGCVIEGAKIPADLQAKFKNQHPKYLLTYVGNNNRGLELNDAVSTLPFQFVGHRGGVSFDFETYGGLFGKGQKAPTILVMEFEDIVLIPGSNDFYIRGQIPVYGKEKDIYARVIMDGETSNAGKSTTAIIPFDLSKEEQPLALRTEPQIQLVNVLRKYSFSKFAKKGDTLYFLSRMQTMAIPRTDEKGVVEADLIFIPRDKGADDIAGMLR